MVARIQALKGVKAVPESGLGAMPAIEPECAILKPWPAWVDAGGDQQPGGYGRRQRGQRPDAGLPLAHQVDIGNRRAGQETTVGVRVGTARSATTPK
jgi:hypothetical protein